MNNNGIIQEGERLVPDHMRIQDFDTWLNRHALPTRDRDAYADPLDRREAIARLSEEDRYQEDLHSKIFCETKEEVDEKERKRRLLEAWWGLELEILANDGTVIVAPLSQMAESCDTVFVVALAWHRGGFSSSSSTPSSTPSSTNNNNNNNNLINENENKKPSLSLNSHRPSTILRFVDLVLGKSRVSDLPSDLVVDCCRIAHYLQNAAILAELVAILLDSIDAANCYSLSSLADELNLPSLLERSMAHMMERLTSVADDEQVAEYLTPELQRRIAAIQAAIQSSIHSHRSRLYFASIEEFLAIFAERVQYYRERLAQAKEEQQQQLEEDGGRRASACYLDAQAKIERQEARMRTLEIAYTEQKKLFASSGSGSSSGSS